MLNEPIIKARKFFFWLGKKEQKKMIKNFVAVRHREPIWQWP